MANDKPVTEAKLISVLKELRKDIQKDNQKDIQNSADSLRKEFKIALNNQKRELRQELNEDFLETLANYHNGEIIPKLNRIIKDIDSLDQRLKWVQRDLKDMETEFATNIVSKKDFSTLRTEVVDIRKELERLKTKVGLTN